MSKQSRTIALIFAANSVGTIGHGGRIPWKIPDDLPRFKRITSGNTVVMGRKTFESLGSKPLPNRINIVVSSTLEEGDDYYVVRSIEDVIPIWHRFGQGDLFVIGGAEMYRAFYEQAQRIYLTMVDDVTVGDTRYFPEIKDEVWKVTSTQTVNHEDGRHSHTYINLHRR